MRIVISGMFWRQPTVGSGQYLHGLLKGLLQVAPQHEYILLAPAYLSGLHHTDVHLNTRTAIVVVETPFDRRNEHLAKLWYEQLGVPLAACRLNADLLHVPYAAPPLCSTVPVVATIHDIIWWRLPEYRGSSFARAYFRLVAAAARRTAHILADSSHARQDIITHLGCAPERVTAVLLAAGEQFRPIDQADARASVAERYGLDAPFIYYVGGLDARKNLATLVHAFDRLRRAGGPHAWLVIAGRAAGTDPRLFPDIDALIAASGLQHLVRRIDVPYEDNPLLYAAAAAFAFPSRYEGFGLPPLEAMACGTPTVVADASSLPEVVGDAALRIPPDDVPGWATTLWRLLADADLRTELRWRGLARARSFSYARVAAETLAIYQQVAQDRR